jgi:uncharacterized repeat protein (TIGR03803 family)
MTFSRFQKMCNFIRWSLVHGALVIVALNLITALSPAATLTTLASFNGPNGSYPQAELIADATGNLYGTTYFGGASDRGTVFRLDAGTNALTTVVSFSGVNGRYPYAGLVADAAGNLYGTTASGGTYGNGTVFRVDAATNALTTLASFNGANGADPFAELMADATGNLYGTTRYGGADDGGTVFRLDAATNTLTTLASFNGANGSGPEARLIADAAGNLYGTTLFGGANDAGTVFRLEAGTHTLTTLVNFAGANGAYSHATLIADAAGYLYGTTEGGGASGYGTVFRLSDAGFIVVPEPATLMILSIGSMSLAMKRWRG